MSRPFVVFLVYSSRTLLTCCECLVYASAHLYLGKHFILCSVDFSFFKCVYVCEWGSCTYLHLWGGQTLGESVVSFQLWVLGISLWSSYLLANAFTCWAILPAPVQYFQLLCSHEEFWFTIGTLDSKNIYFTLCYVCKFPSNIKIKYLHYLLSIRNFFMAAITCLIMWLSLMLSLLSLILTLPVLLLQILQVEFRLSRKFCFADHMIKMRKRKRRKRGNIEFEVFGLFVICNMGTNIVVCR